MKLDPGMHIGMHLVFFGKSGVTMYNLPTWLCQKRKYIFLFTMIQGPKAPGIDIDVFLEPLMQEIETSHGIKILDGFIR
jgi:hypothetical protein